MSLLEFVQHVKLSGIDREDVYYSKGVATYTIERMTPAEFQVFMEDLESLAIVEFQQFTQELENKTA